jgi:hypothetical protein
MEFQNALGLCPERLRPLTSGKVTDIISGRSTARSAKHRLYRVDRGLRVQRVEDGFDHQQVDATIQEAMHRLRVITRQLLKVDVARTGVVDVRRDRRGAGGRAQHAGDETGLVGRFFRDRVGHAAGDPRAGFVEFPRQVPEAVIILGNGGGIERIGLDDVRAGVQVGAVYVGDKSGRVRDRRSLLPRRSTRGRRNVRRGSPARRARRPGSWSPWRRR